MYIFSYFSNRWSVIAIVRGPVGISWFPGTLWVKEDREGRFPYRPHAPLRRSHHSWLSWMGGVFPEAAQTVSVWGPYPIWVNWNPLELAFHWSSFGAIRDWVRKASQRMTYDSLDLYVPVALVLFSFITSFICKDWYTRVSQLEV